MIDYTMINKYSYQELREEDEFEIAGYEIR